MIARLILVAAVVISTTSCKKLSVTETLGGIDYAFFDDFNRADATFASSTVYTAYPDGADIHISNQAVIPLSMSHFMSLIRTEAFSIAHKAVSLKINNAGGAANSIFGGPAMTQVSDLNSGPYLMCGFSYTSNLKIIGTGDAILASGTESYDLTLGQDTTLVLTNDGTNVTCTAVMGETTEVLTYAYPSPSSLTYAGFYVGGDSALKADDLGVFDVDANSSALARLQRGARR